MILAAVAALEDAAAAVVLAGDAGGAWFAEAEQGINNAVLGTAHAPEQGFEGIKRTYDWYKSEVGCA